ncbi:MAG: DNA alkylation repair protein [Actinobacteria bacterium]|nr:DNA alkylation repair protein [Actinomycetota bacterium]
MNTGGPPDAAGLDGKTWPTVRKEALAFAAEDPADAVAHLEALFARPEWEPRFFAVCAVGPLAATDPAALRALRAFAASEPDWQINEGLAFAFDDYCAGVGYEQALPEIRSWLGSEHANQRRTVSEGLRRWTDARRPYFHHHPDEAVALLATLRGDDSPYVQKSVGNAMRDIWKAHPDLVLEAVRAWVGEEPGSRGRRTIARLALKAAVIDDPELEALWRPPR